MSSHFNERFIHSFGSFGFIALFNFRRVLDGIGLMLEKILGQCPGGALAIQIIHAETEPIVKSVNYIYLDH